MSVACLAQHYDVTVSGGQVTPISGSPLPYTYIPGSNTAAANTGTTWGLAYGGNVTFTDVWNPDGTGQPAPASVLIDNRVYGFCLDYNTDYDDTLPPGVTVGDGFGDPLDGEYISPGVQWFVAWRDNLTLVTTSTANFTTVVAPSGSGSLDSDCDLYTSMITTVYIPSMTVQGLSATNANSVLIGQALQATVSAGPFVSSTDWTFTGGNPVSSLYMSIGDNSGAYTPLSTASTGSVISPTFYYTAKSPDATPDQISAMVHMPSNSYDTSNSLSVPVMYPNPIVSLEPYVSLYNGQIGQMQYWDDSTQNNQYVSYNTVFKLHGALYTPTTLPPTPHVNFGIYYGSAVADLPGYDATGYSTGQYGWVQTFNDLSYWASVNLGHIVHLHPAASILDFSFPYPHNETGVGQVSQFWAAPPLPSGVTGVIPLGPNWADAPGFINVPNRPGGDTAAQDFEACVFYLYLMYQPPPSSVGPSIPVPVRTILWMPVGLAPSTFGSWPVATTTPVSFDLGSYLNPPLDSTAGYDWLPYWTVKIGLGG